MHSRLIRYMILMTVGSLAMLGLVSSAMATEPTGEYKVFNECPLTASKINSCVYSLTTSGEVKIGSTSTPIVNPIVFQGGETREIVELPDEEEIEKRTFVGAANGETLTKSPQPVRGGLAGLVNCDEISEPVAKLACKLVFENGLTGVNVTTELVGSADYSFDRLASREPDGLVMETRLHLENPLLGSKCYIGSASEPITFHFTTASPCSPGKAKVLPGGSLIMAEEDSVVDDSFSVPVANGCGGLLSAALAPVIDLQLGLPSASGNNSATLNGTLEQAGAGAVKANVEEHKKEEEK